MAEYRLSLRHFVRTLVFLYLFSLTRVQNVNVKVMGIPKSDDFDRTRNHLYHTDEKVNERKKTYGTAIRFSNENIKTYIPDDYQPGPPECQVCDERLPLKRDYNEPTPRLNLQTRVSGAECCCVNKTHVNCTSCGLNYIPTSFSSDITSLIMNHNAITENALSGSPFKRYSQLRVLSLIDNRIKSLPEDAFEGLPRLRCLCLQYNHVEMDENLNSSRAFKPLAASLVYLRLNGMTMNLTSSNLMYPSYALSFLPKLSYLYIDGLPYKRFENPGQQLNITHLSMNGYWYGYSQIYGLLSETFELDNLSYLDISDCHIDGRHVNKSALANLKKLEYLIINNNFYFGIQNMGKLMFGQRENKNLKVLKMQRINPRFTPCIVVYKFTLRNFKNTGLREIHATDNKIEVIEKGAVLRLPDTLRLLDLTNNKIIFGEYIKDLGRIKGLTTLILDKSTMFYNFPEVYPMNVLTSCARYNKSSDLEEYREAVHDAQIKSIPVPHNLEYLTMFRNEMAYTLNNMSFSTPNKLKVADLTLNAFERLIGPIRGLEKLETLILNLCLIKDISCRFFDHFNGLKNLSLYGNLLDDRLAMDSDGCIFKNLVNLTYMDLSHNDIYHLSRNAFNGMVNTELLNVSANKINTVNFSIAHMKNLQILDLKKNSIQYLTPITILEVEEISKGRQMPRIDLSYNPILCTCDHLEFLEWFSDKILIHTNFSQERYYCDMIQQHEGYAQVIQRLRRECIKKTALFVLVTCVTLMIMLALLGVLAYRFRWTLRYWYHAAKLRFQPVISPEIFEYDVFVSYSDKDNFVEEELIPKLQDEFHLRVMMHGLCFPAGGHITDSIHMAVTTSRKTLVVITKNMLSSHWCNYELMMARREAIRRGRQVLVFLFLEDLDYTDMTSAIASYIRESTYITYPPDLRHRGAFWRKLADDLQADNPMT